MSLIQPLIYVFRWFRNPWWPICIQALVSASQVITKTVHIPLLNTQHAEQ